MDVRPSESSMAAFEAVSTAIPSPSCKHVLHIFPSFGIGGVPLRMVRVINHFGRDFNHTVIALDNDYAAADGFSGDVDVVLSSTQQQKRGTIRSVLGGALALRSMRPDLLFTCNWGAIEWAMVHRLVPGSRHNHIQAGLKHRGEGFPILRRVLLRRRGLDRRRPVLVASLPLGHLAH